MMKNLTFILLFLSFYRNSFAQTIDETIEKNGNSIFMTINNKNLSMDVDNNSNEIIMTFKELEMIVKKQILLYKPNIKKDTILVSGKKQVTLSLNLDTVRFNCLILQNVPAKIVYTIPEYNPKATAKIGLNLLKKYGNVTVNSNEIVVKNISANNTMPSCLQTQTQQQPVNQPNNQQSPTNTIQIDLKEIKFICCNAKYYYSYKDNIKDLLQKTYTNFSNYTDEPNIPPQKAIDRLKEGTTIRYFDDDDLAIVQELYKTMNTQFGKTSPSEQIYIENMRPLFKNPIPKYIEIWIKQ